MYVKRIAPNGVRAFSKEGTNVGKRGRKPRKAELNDKEMAEAIKRETKERRLTKMQHDFIDHYMVTHNAAKAAEMAGYSTNSAKGISVQAVRLLANSNIKNEIARRRLEIQRKTGITAEWVVEKLSAAIEAAGKAGDRTNEIAGLRLAAQHLGMLVSRTESSTKLQVENQAAVPRPKSAEQFNEWLEALKSIESPKSDGSEPKYDA